MTSERSARVRIDDWAEPRFAVEMAQMRATVAPLPAQLRLERNVLLPDAAAQAGLDDFGRPDFQERLDVFLYAMREEAGLSPWTCCRPTLGHLDAAGRQQAGCSPT